MTTRRWSARWPPAARGSTSAPPRWRTRSGAPGRSPRTASGSPSGSTSRSRTARHRLAARGWTTDGGDLWETLERLDRDGCARYVVTDVSKDGTLRGPERRPAARGRRGHAGAGDRVRRHRRGVRPGRAGRRPPPRGRTSRARSSGRRSTPAGSRCPRRWRPCARSGRPGRIRHGERRADMGVAVRVIPCLDVDAGPGGQGRQLPEPARRRRPGRDGRRLRRRGRRRADVPRRHGVVGRAGDDGRRRPPHRRAGVHPADRRRRASARRTTSTGMLRAGADKVGVNTAAIARPELLRRDGAGGSGRSASCCRSTRARCRRAARRRRRAGRSPRTAAAAAPGSTRSSGRRAARSWAWGRSCSTPWTPTAPAPASTSR